MEDTGANRRAAEQSLSDDGSGDGRPQDTNTRGILLATLLTSLVWVSAGGLAMLLWRRPQPMAFDIQPPPATATPQPTPTASPTATLAPLVVDVAGAVQQPGIYQLTPDSRVQAAIDAAGGVLLAADLRGLSLARPLQDGEKVYIPAQGETLPPLPTPEPSLSGEGEAPAKTSFPININEASAEALEALPGIGPKTAQAMIEYRQANGPFPTVDSITAVKGIGQGTLEKIRDLIVVE